jgi:hypothetical protein
MFTVDNSAVMLVPEDRRSHSARNARQESQDEILQSTTFCWRGRFSLPPVSVNAARPASTRIVRIMDRSFDYGDDMARDAHDQPARWKFARS